MKSRVSWLVMFASFGIGCGLVQVNGKPVTLGSSSSKGEKTAEAKPPESAQPSQPKQQASAAQRPATTASTEPAPAKSAGSAGSAGKTLKDIPEPGAKHRVWTPIQQ